MLKLISAVLYVYNTFCIYSIVFNFNLYKQYICINTALKQCMLSLMFKVLNRAFHTIKLCFFCYPLIEWSLGRSPWDVGGRLNELYPWGSGCGLVRRGPHDQGVPGWYYAPVMYVEGCIRFHMERQGTSLGEHSTAGKWAVRKWIIIQNRAPTKEGLQMCWL